MALEDGPRSSGQILKAYRTTFAAAVCLAAIGAPLLMQGVVALVTGLVKTDLASGGPVRGLILFVASTVPMGLAAYAWRLTQRFQRALDEQR